jgi:rRNA maturation endonuclease Nob1
MQTICRACLRLFASASVNHRTSCPRCGGALAAHDGAQQ